MRWEFFHADMDVVSVGCERLDALLGGGIPRERSLLVTGPPGTGKTTFGMQFLQAGIDRGEDCLFVTTEQSIAELRDTFEPYPFDVDAAGLNIVAVNAEPGESLESGRDLVVRTVDGGDATVAEWFDLPFTRENVVHYLSELGPADRVVLDSVSGIRPMADGRISFWRSCYSLIRLLTESFRATAVLTAGRGSDSWDTATDLIEYATHGVCEIAFEQVAGQRHRFVRVVKMRGRDHDDRRHKLLLTDEGVRVRPGDRTEPAGLLDYDHFPTGVPALDELLGGGLVRGGLTTLKHDGTTDYYTLVGRLLARAADAGMTLAVALPAEVSLDRLDGYWRDTDWDVDRLFAADRLIVLELAGKNGRDHRNVLSYDAGADRDWERLMERTYERAGSDPLFALVDTEPLLQTVSDERAREVRYRAATARTGDDDVVVYTVNPRIQPDPFVGFLVDTSYQTLDFYRDEDGLEWLSVEKTPTGSPGASRLVAYESDPPYVDFV